MKSTLCICAVFLSCLQVQAADCKELVVYGLKTIPVGGTVKVQVGLPSDFSGKGYLQFGFRENVIPNYLQVYQAGTAQGFSGHIKADADAIGGKAASAQQDYQILYTYSPRTDLPRIPNIWIYARGHILLKDAAGKDIKWLFAGPGPYRWRRFPGYSKEYLGGGFSLCSEKKSVDNPGVLSCVLITDEPTFVPKGKDFMPNIFLWKTDPSSIGRHSFPTKLLQDGKVLAEGKCNIEIIPPKKTSKITNVEQTQGELEGFKPITMPKANFSGFNKERFVLLPEDVLAEAKATFESHYNFTYPKGSGFIGLFGTLDEDSQKLPKAVTISVNRKAGGLVFLQAEMGSGNIGELVMVYRVKFSNGKVHDIPIREGEEINGWFKPVKAAAAKNIYSVFNGSVTNKIYLYKWQVPSELVKHEIESITPMRPDDSVFAGNRNPLYVTENFPVILAMGTLTKPKAGYKEPLNNKEKNFATVNFSRELNTISPYLFGTNESEWRIPGPDERYNRQMALMGPKIIRIHFNYLCSMRGLFPNPDVVDQEFSFDVSIFGKTFLRPDRQGQEIIFCFGNPVDFSTAKKREIYAGQCMKLARFLVKEKKYPIKYWQPFNEPYHGGLKKERNAWKFYNLLARKLKQMDPQAKVGGPVYCYPSLGIIEDFLKHCGRNVDFVSWHLYPTGSVETPTESLMARTNEFGQTSLSVRKLTKRYIKRKVPMALTEYHMNYDWKRPDPRHLNNIGACWMASVLKHLIDAEHEIGTTWHSKRGVYGLIHDDDSIRPTGSVIELFNNYFGGNERVLSRSTNKDIQISAVQGPTHQAVMVINKSAKKQSIELTLLNLRNEYKRSNDLNRFVKEFRISEKDNPMTEIRKYSEFLPHSLPQLEVELEPYSVRLFVYSRGLDN